MTRDAIIAALTEGTITKEDLKGINAEARAIAKRSDPGFVQAEQAWYDALVAYDGAKLAYDDAKTIMASARNTFREAGGSTGGRGSGNGTSDIVGAIMFRGYAVGVAVRANGDQGNVYARSLPKGYTGPAPLPVDKQENVSRPVLAKVVLDTVEYLLRWNGLANPSENGKAPGFASSARCYGVLASKIDTSLPNDLPTFYHTTDEE